MKQQKKIIILIKNILLRSWLSFSFFAILLGILTFITFNQNSHWPFFVGGWLAIFLIPMVIVKEIFKHYMSELDSHYAFVWGSIFFPFFLLYCTYLAGGKWEGWLNDMFLTATFSVIILSVPNYFFQKHLAPNKSAQIIISILGVCFVIMFFYTGKNFYF